MKYDFVVVHRPGRHHQAADAMSLLQNEKCHLDDDSLKEDVLTMDFNGVTIKSILI